VVLQGLDEHLRGVTNLLQSENSLDVKEGLILSHVAHLPNSHCTGQQHNPACFTPTIVKAFPNYVFPFLAQFVSQVDQLV
jgi:hypothetical protein